MGVRYGQNFLRDHNILKKIVSNLKSDEGVILEIGCGDAALSELLLDHCHCLHIIEIDHVCIEKTRQRLQEKATLEKKEIIFHHQDVLSVDLRSIFKQEVCIVANVPYYISAKLMQWMVSQRALISNAYLMFQKEVVQKFVAKPGQDLYTSLSVYAQYYFDMKYLFTVSAQCFRPVPQVESAFMSLKKNHLHCSINEALFFIFVRSCFWARRKTLKRALLTSPYLTVEESCTQESDFKRYEKRRAETLTLKEFLHFFSVLEPFIKDA